MAQAREIKIHGHRIYYEESGAGEPLVLVHGWSGSSFDWRLVVPILAERYRVLALDQIGFGRSDKPRIHYTIENFVEYLDEFIGLVGSGQVHLAGNSMGGHIVCEYALSYPAKARSLILIDAAGVRANLPFFFRLARVPKLLEWILSMTSAESFRRFMESRGPYYNRQIITEELVRGHMQSFLSKEGIHAAADSLRRNIGVIFVEDRLGELKIPVLILWGKDDSTLPVSMSYTFHRKIKGSKLVILDECGHIPMEEKPQDCATAMLNLLAESGRY
jgi:pimeloyl-ACP methyl ester carboxylesterase